MIKITESRVEDLDALRNLFFRTRLSTFSQANRPELKLSDFETETAGEYILVAFVDEMIAGFISVWMADHFIHHLYVDEKFQNQGVGTELLHAVLDKLTPTVRLKCEATNTKAVRFYLQKGFEEKERGQSETGTYILFEMNKRIE